MAKLTLDKAKKAVGIGSLVEKTIKFRHVDGNPFEGEIFIKVLSSEEVANITDILKLKKDEKYTIDQYRAAMLVQAVFEGKDKPFFPDLESTGQISDEMKVAMYLVADEVINFTGKHWLLMKSQNSTANSSAAESVEAPLQKQEET
ncbi:hypothetical protein B9T23_13840 [Acinetobacter terrae]|uniref:phage tail assembly chaperone family protein, TAC n=1 Tax=Acinetobacter terrae TaxID=2731247 RepID=UPI000A355C1F|nr:phage tail assembly chaperone family protein, TAC [Acinetobacter terrae]OTG73428.1 hypothetical protein B9T23_13840 [Acinetobacter terrae]